MIDKIIDKFISLFQLEKGGDRKKKYGYFEGIFSIVVNMLLFLIKFILGTVFNSVVLLADALHSLSDVITSAIVIFGFRVSRKPADSKHPFGHGRAERIVSIVIACMLIVVGFEFFMNGLHRAFEPIPIEVNTYVIIFLFFSILVKEFLYRVSLILSKRIESSSLKAEAWHHRTDAFSTVFVIIGFILFRYELFRWDGILGMAISGLILYTGISIIIESSSFLMGEAPSSSLVKKIKEVALCCDGISDVHHIHVHDYGGNTEITIHIRLKPDTQLDEAHRKATEVERVIKQNISGSEVTVHIEPEHEKNNEI